MPVASRMSAARVRDGALMWVGFLPFCCGRATGRPPVSGLIEMKRGCTLVHIVKARANPGKQGPLFHKTPAAAHGDGLGDGHGETTAPGAHAGISAQSARRLESPPLGLMRYRFPLRYLLVSHSAQGMVLPLGDHARS